MKPSTLRALRRALRWTAPLLILALLGGCNWMRRRQSQRPPYRKLSPPVAYELIRDNPAMLVLDLRPPREFDGETGHIRRAQNMPLDRLPYRMLELSSYREETFLVYCRADDCGDRGMAVLLSSGFENVILMEGGIDAWIRLGFRTVLPQSAVGRSSQDSGPMRPLRPGEKLVAPEVEITPPPPY